VHRNAVLLSDKEHSNDWFPARLIVC